MMEKEITHADNETGATENAPFRIVLHVGAGKTGTSSIQGTLLTQKDKLIAQGTWYLGIMLEQAPVKKFSWQSARGFEKLCSLNSEQGTKQILDVLHESISQMQAAGCKQAVWSNEAFLGKRRTAVIDAMRQLVDEGIDVRVVAYVRRHDAWARSAYVQWGVKHKTYRGELQPFDTWIKKGIRYFVDDLTAWSDMFSGKMMVRNLDAVGDAVSDFIQVAGINPDGIELLRRNESPSGEELTLRALFNQQFKTKVPVGMYQDVLEAKSLHFDQPIGTWLEPMMPTQQALAAVVDECASDRELLNEMLQSSGQAPIDTSPLPQKSITVNSDKLLGVISQLVIKQAIKIDDMQKEIVNIKSEPNKPTMVSAPAVMANKSSGAVGTISDAPVFAISTGRSGSTLVQRVLNCHRDLVLWGEHYGFLNGMATVYAQMSDKNQTIYPKKAVDNTGVDKVLPTLQDPAAPLEWVNPWSLQEFKLQIKQFIENYFASRLEPGQRWGFKEIRYNSMQTLRMLKELYPNGKFVFIKRDALDVTRSKVFAFIKESKWSNYSDAEKESRIASMLNDVSEHYRIYDLFMKRNPGRGLVVDYEELVSNPKEVTAQMLSHFNLDPARFDWDLGDQVMGSIITRTKRDDEVIELIRSVADKIETANS